MNDIQPYHFDPEGTLEDDSDCFKESGIVEVPATLTGVCVNSLNQLIQRRNLLFAILCKIWTVF